MIQFVKDEVFIKMSLDEKKQYLKDIVEKLPDDKVKLLHTKLEKAGFFAAKNDQEKQKEILKSLVEKDEE